MKMKVSFALLSLMVSIGCSRDSELKRSVFISDPQSPGLPIYSEWGYNTFGAYYNREVIVSNDYEIPVQVVHDHGRTSFIFTGQKNGVDYYSENSFKMTLTLFDFHAATYQDLIALHGVLIDLEDMDYAITLSDSFQDYEMELLEGEFEFKRAQHLLVDTESHEVILSGVFNMQLLVNGEPVSISDGRFDVGVGAYNFFNH